MKTEQKKTIMEESVYSDHHINNIIKKQKMKFVKSIGFDDIKTAKEAMSEYGKMKEQAITSQEFLRDIISCKNDMQKTQQMLLAYIQKQIALNNGVKKQHIETVVNEVNFQKANQSVFETVLQTFLSENPKYTAKARMEKV